MYKHVSYLVALALLGALAATATAQEWDIEIPSTNTPPIIDGQVDSVWSIASVQEVTKAINGSVDSPEDSSATWQVMWDGDFLYLIVTVKDDQLVNDTGTTWQDDSIEFYFDGGNSKGPGSPLSEDDRQYTFGWTTDDIQGTNTETTGVEHAQVNIDGGWRHEMKFPWSSLTDNIPGLGDLIGIDCFINDDDNGGDTRETQISTFAGSGNDWQIPENWGTGLLVKGSQEKAQDPSPADGATGVARDAVLEWTPGLFANTHDVYFGTVFEDVNNASRANPLDVLVSQDQSDASYDPPGLLEYGQTYYWRIDEVNAAPDNTVFKGDIWSFTIEAFANPVEGIIATSNVPFDTGSGPEKTIDGSGLNELDEHSVDAPDMWLALPAPGEAVSVQYEFPTTQKLHQMLVWNYNSMFEAVLGFGLKDVTIEHSENGADWTVLGDFVFAQATGRATYTANTTIEFGGVSVRFVRLTKNSGYGMMGQFGLSEVRFLAIPVQAREPNPADGAVDADALGPLSWRAGRQAVSHIVYLGTDPEALAQVDTTTATSHTPGPLDLATDYYWRVDEVNEAEAISLWEGNVWSFTTQEFLVVDDFEAYNDEDNVIYDSWVDGWINGTGSTVGYLVAPFAERAIVNGGSQAMPLFYDNAGLATAEADLTLGQDWTASGIGTLSLYFYGDPANTGGPLYVKIDGTKIDYEGDAAAITTAAWQLWTIDLSGVAGLANVNTLTIGIEGAGASGVLYIDDVRLSP